jgi:hypothetical protein
MTTHFFLNILLVQADERLFTLLHLSYVLSVGLRWNGKDRGDGKDEEVNPGSTGLLPGYDG